MTRTRAPHSDQLLLDWEQDPAVRAAIEARIARRAKAAALRWRLRLVAIETFMMGALVTITGIALHQPFLSALRAGIIVAAGCFASGMLLIGLSGACGKLVSRVRQWRHR
ncbi:hypothetical protein [Sphingobium sp.]|uniref:hypothetical protein n=1 Tax=Sphingobium sp. TaxID=1912891 RepID=UPI002C278600|nr:hypothetical protein [Sphingobium sp.]HUD93891.1 hypothetical protein [Sphingobium sp.]